MTSGDFQVHETEPGSLLGGHVQRPGDSSGEMRALSWGGAGDAILGWYVEVFPCRERESRSICARILCDDSMRHVALELYFYESEIGSVACKCVCVCE